MQDGFFMLDESSDFDDDACDSFSTAMPERYDYVELSRIVETHSRTTLMIMSFFPVSACP